jgi:uncharacterized glyoxalase superfamily protein PhnB
VAGVAPRTVQRAEEGSASAETLRALAAALDVPVQELVKQPEQVLTPCLFYDDPAAALEWLPRGFGFEVVERVVGPNGAVMHAEVAVGGARIMIGPSGWLPMITNPLAAHGVTQMVWVAVEDATAHCARAREAGAQIVAEPQNQGYGKRTYRAVDPFGHLWSFAGPAT